LGVTAHFFSKFKLKSVYLGVLHVSDRHTSQELAAKLKEVFTKFNITVEFYDLVAVWWSREA